MLKFRFTPSEFSIATPKRAKHFYTVCAVRVVTARACACACALALTGRDFMLVILAHERRTDMRAF